MKILKIEIINYKKIKIFQKELNGDNMAVAGNVGTGKTTAISALWDIIEKVGDSLTHGEKNGKIRITLGNESKKVFAERKFTEKTNQVIILTSEGNKISVADFKNWYNKLGINPHKILGMKPLEQTKALLNAVKLPDGIDLDKLDQKRVELETKRKEAFQKTNILKSQIEEKPKVVEYIDTEVLLKEYDQAKEHNYQIETKIQEKVRLKELYSSIESEIKNLQETIEAKKISLNEAKQNYKNVIKEISNSVKKDTCEIELKIKQAEENNNLEYQYNQWRKRKNEYDFAKREYDNLDMAVKEIDGKKKKAVSEAKWPLKNISVENGHIVYGGCLLSNCGTSKQLLVCGAIAANGFKENELKVVRLDGIESMSKEDFEVLVKIFNEKGVQVLSSRVSRDNIEENEITIEEGVFTDKR